MNSTVLAERLRDRISQVGLEPAADVQAGCVAYLTLLARWNQRLNLTALPLADPISDVTLDKLIVEPLVAGSLLPDSTARWLDLGSGGGSPALPLRLVHRSGWMGLVEARERKCAFLREGVRTLELGDTKVISARFETLSLPRPVDLVTSRAVRMDSELLDRVASWVSPGGALMLFGAPVEDARFDHAASTLLPDGSQVRLYVRR